MKGKTAIITGGSRGIGEGIAKAFAREGVNLVLSARDTAELEAAQQEISKISAVNVELFPSDVSKTEDVQGLVDFTMERFSDIDILVNCAGIYGPIGPITEIDTEKWLEAVHINLFGTMLCIKSVLPTMMKKNSGKIVNMSGGGAASPLPRFSAYSASKAAVVRLTETLARELDGYNIDINAIAPGAVNTKMLEDALDAGDKAGEAFKEKALKQKQEGGVPIDKVAGLAVFLASPVSDGITGRLISLLWDRWSEMPQHLDTIKDSDVYTLRRIVPEDRGMDWLVK